MILTVRPAIREEAVWLSSRLRPEDRAEVEIASGKSAEIIVPASFDASDEVYSVHLERNGRPVAEPVSLLGVAQHIQYPNVGVPWLLSTSDIRHGSLALLRDVVPFWRDAWARKYSGGLHNIIDADNKLYLRWLIATGFTLGESVTIRNHPFIHFSRKHKD